MKYIDSEKLIAEIERLKERAQAERVLHPKTILSAKNYLLIKDYDALLSTITSLQQEAQEEETVRKERCDESFMSYWKSVIDTINNKRVLPSFKGQLLHDFKNELHTMKQIIGLINHPEIHEGLFDMLALVFAAWGGYHFHPKEYLPEDSLQQEQTPTEREIAEAHRYAEMIRERDKARIQQEQLEVDLEKFTEKIKTFQGRYKYPEILSIKGAMAFMARMFYQYPNIARQWYDSLPKTTMD